jgi:ankyrin repeat protein
MSPVSHALSEVWNAIADGDCSKVDALIAEGLDVNAATESDQWNFLHMALETLDEPIHPDMVEHLINLGVDVNGKDTQSWTPLHFAARAKCARSVKLLIEAGAEIDAVDDEGITPLHQSLLEDPFNLEVIQLLLDAGADPDRDNGMVRRYVNAIDGEDVDAVRKLLKIRRKK